MPPWREEVPDPVLGEWVPSLHVDYAIATGEQCGIWGGLNVHERGANPGAPGEGVRHDLEAAATPVVPTPTAEEHNNHEHDQYQGEHASSCARADTE